MLYGLIAEVIGVVNLFMTSFFVRWIADDNASDGYGFLYAGINLALVASGIIARHRFFFWSTCLGVNIRKGLYGIIFKKVLKFNQKSLAQASTGKIVTIVSGELQVIEQGIGITPYVIIAPISTTLAFILIGINFKEGAALGFATFILIVVCQYLMAKVTVKWKYNEGVFSDKRVKSITDAINGIRTIKAYGWEIPYNKVVKSIRSKQFNYLIKNHLMNAIGSGIFMNGGFIIVLVIFGYHYGMGREFDYSRSLSTVSLLSYLSTTSIFFSYYAINNFATF